MNQSSANESYNLLTLACQILATAKERAHHQSVAADIKEIWDILQMLGLRPTAIRSDAAELRKLLITGHIAEARKIFLNAPPATASEDEKNKAFKALCDNLVAALRMPPPPAPSQSAPPVTTETTCAVLVMHDPFQNPPNDAAKIIGGTFVDAFEEGGDEPMEVSESDIRAADPSICNGDGPANDCAGKDSTLQSMETPRDQAVVERFFGGPNGAKQFGFVPAPKLELTSEALLAEMEAVSPPHSDEIACAEKAQEEQTAFYGTCNQPEAVRDCAS